ncbi:ABC transporter permease [Nocardioides sp. W7]|uniref:ABC transporter permease n=1 Tax=Nocardioides sp. W7 TaxID=2931390 RepID=UPI001FCF7E42|nr:ABC transporter permease [Nocardioides sp. W7]
MLSYILSKVFQTLATFGLVVLGAFAMLRLAPGDPALAQAGVAANREQVELIREQMGLNRPFTEQLWEWFSGAFTGDLGVSYADGAKVTEVIGTHVGPTLQLVALTTALTILLCVPLGIWTAVGTSRAARWLGNTVTVLGPAVPNFVVGIMLVLIFGWLVPGILPYYGYVSVREDFFGALSHTILPALALMTSGVAIIARVLRASIIETLNDDFVFVGTALGVPPRRLLWTDVLRNSLVAATTVFGLFLGVALSGSVVLENAFGIPGLGALLVDSFDDRDYPVTIGTTLVIVAAVLLVNLVVDLLYLVLAPRVRFDLGVSS